MPVLSQARRQNLDTLQYRTRSEAMDDTRHSCAVTEVIPR